MWNSARLSTRRSQMCRCPVWENVAPASHRFTSRSFEAASTAFEILEKLASTRASRPSYTRDAHHQQLPLPQLEISCTRVRLLPAEITSRSSAFALDDPRSLRACAFVRASERNPAFHDAKLTSVSPSNLPGSFRPAVIRCEPTSDIPVAFVSRFARRGFATA